MVEKQQAFELEKLEQLEKQQAFEEQQRRGKAAIERERAAGF